MANAFNKGDVVILKSGGPPMTVDEVPGDPRGFESNRVDYLCEWFKRATPLRGTYAEHLLERYTPLDKR